MKFYEYFECLKDEPEPSFEVIAACAYLEAKGYQICVHYGFRNALEVAEQVYTADCGATEG